MPVARASMAGGIARPRRAAYERAMAVLLRDRPYIYLWHPKTFFALRPALEGLRLIPDGLIRVQGLRLRG